MSNTCQAHQIYEKAIAIDGLNVSNWNSPAVYQSLRSSGITAINATSAVWDNYREGLDQVAAWQQRFSQYSDILVPIRTTRDIIRAKEDHKVGIIIGWQNASPIENDLKRLALFHQLGLRIVQLTYNERNLLGNGCYERRDEGLSHFGVDAIHEMNRLGILIDLSHVGDRTTLEAIEVSEKPVAFTHANARAHFDHVRNKTDEALKKLAARGGVVGANAFPAFFPRLFDSTLADYADAIDDLVERLGIDHVGIGTDYTQDQPQAFFDRLYARQGTGDQKAPLVFPDPMRHPQDMETPDKFSHIAVELCKRGYSDEDTGKILGGNWLRLFQKVWQ